MDLSEIYFTKSDPPMETGPSTILFDEPMNDVDHYNPGVESDHSGHSFNSVLTESEASSSCLVKTLESTRVEEHNTTSESLAISDIDLLTPNDSSSESGAEIESRTPGRECLTSDNKERNTTLMREIRVADTQSSASHSGHKYLVQGPSFIRGQRVWDDAVGHILKC